MISIFLLIAAAQTSSWEELPRTTAMSPMLFDCGLPAAWWSVAVYKTGNTDRIRVKKTLGKEPLDGLSWSGAATSVSRLVKAEGTTFRVVYRDRYADEPAEIKIDLLLPTGRDGITEMDFELRTAKTTISHHCTRAPNGMPGWQDRPEAWK